MYIGVVWMCLLLLLRYIFCIFVLIFFKLQGQIWQNFQDQILQMVRSTISWPQVFVLFWDFVVILNRLLWEYLRILPLVSIGVLIWLQIYKFFEVRDYKFLQEPENFITNFNILEMTSKYIILRLGSRNWRDLLP